VIWSKTEAGRVEIQARALVKERAQRNLLLVIDGIKTDEMLLTHLAGISAADFDALYAMGLITPMGGVRVGPGSARPAGAPAPATPSAVEQAPLDYAQFTAALTQMISRELGLRGFVLTLAVEKASTAEELSSVAQRTLVQIAERKGEGAAAAARRLLYGN
jgi:hypothetical protein